MKLAIKLTLFAGVTTLVFGSVTSANAQCSSSSTYYGGYGCSSEGGERYYGNARVYDDRQGRCASNQRSSCATTARSSCSANCGCLKCRFQKMIAYYQQREVRKQRAVRGNARMRTRDANAYYYSAPTQTRVRSRASGNCASGS